LVRFVVIEQKTFAKSKSRNVVFKVTSAPKKIGRFVAAVQQNFSDSNTKTVLNCSNCEWKDLNLLYSKLLQTANHENAVFKVTSAAGEDGEVGFIIMRNCTER